MKSDISNIRILESEIYSLNHYKTNKLNSHIKKGILVDFISINYKIYIPEKRAIIIVRDIRINEKNTFKKNEENSLINIDYLLCH